LNYEKAIEIKQLSKNFKALKAVNNLNLNVYHGDVFGFLGPNGAGKSTTIRMLLTLIAPNGGEISIFDKPLKRNRDEILKRVGAIVEKPDFYGYLSAYKNLEILSRISGNDVSKKRLWEVLEMVGLEKRHNSKVKTFSHGMKQRLGLAQALVHDPDLIILDEPTTGLDPQGMKEIRDLIVFLSKEKGKTIFLSSHILYEVELVANRMIIINKGSAVVEGLVEDLLNSSSLQVTFEVSDAEKALSAIELTEWKNKLGATVNDKLVFNMEKNEISALNRRLIENGIDVSAVVPTRSLEEYFLQLTDKGEGK
jgi:ABC-2 type transport system ATP-binding protein